MTVWHVVCWPACIMDVGLCMHVVVTQCHNSDVWLHYACHTLLVWFSVCGSEMICVYIFVLSRVNTFIYNMVLNLSAQFHFHLAVILFVVWSAMSELHVHGPTESFSVISPMLAPHFASSLSIRRLWECLQWNEKMVALFKSVKRLEVNWSWFGGWGWGTTGKGSATPHFTRKKSQGH